MKQRSSSKSKKDKEDNEETSSGKVSCFLDDLLNHLLPDRFYTNILSNLSSSHFFIFLNTTQLTVFLFLFSDKSLQLAKVGTLKRKRQIREILTKQNSSNTLLDSTPMKSIKTSKIPFVDAMSPMSFGTPPVNVLSKAKVRRRSSPRVYTPTNRIKQDRYIKELERRNKVNVGKPGESSRMSDSVSSKSTSPKAPVKDLSKVLGEDKRPSVDSDCSMDEYFSELDSFSESD